MTKLEAVNQVLLDTGGLPVPVLDTSGGSSATVIEKMLDMETSRAQREGWFFNTLYDKAIDPDVNGKIAIPAGVIQISLVRESTNVAEVNGFLYDQDNNTDVFNRTVYTTQVIERTFTQIPLVIQQYIVALTTERYIERRLKDPSLMRPAREERLRAHTAARQYDADQAGAKANIQATRDVRDVMGDDSTFDDDGAD